MTNLIDTPMMTAIAIVGIIVIIAFSIISMWKKVPQDKALVVTGMKKRVISGGGGIVIPLLERTDIISLENMQIPVRVKAMTSAGVDINVSALTILKIKNERAQILAAMEQFNTGKLDTTINNIKETSEEVLEGKLREILASLTVEDVYKDREKFATSVQEVAAKELEDMGLEIKAFTIKEISDDQGYLDSLGKKQVAEVKKNAAIAESNALKEQELTLAENARETSVKKAELEKDTAIQISVTKQEEAQARAAAETKIAEAEKEKQLILFANEEAIQRKKVQADVAYEIEENIRQQEIIETKMQAEVLQQQKNIDLTKAKMEVERTKEVQETEVAKQKALRRQEELNSEIQKSAEAKAAEMKTMAEADLFKRTKDAEGAKLEEIAQAQAEAEKKKLQAEAEAQAIRDTGLAEAEATKAKGVAQADAIEAQGLAEARIIKEKALAEAEAMKEKAEAYKQYGDAAKMEMMIGVLPEITKAISEAVVAATAQIDSISIIDTGGGGNGMHNIAAMTTKLLTEIPAAVKAATGLDLTQMIGNIGDTGLSNNEIKSDKKNTQPEIPAAILTMNAERLQNTFTLPAPLAQAIENILDGGTLGEYINANGLESLAPLKNILDENGLSQLSGIIDAITAQTTA